MKPLQTLQSHTLQSVLFRLMTFRLFLPLLLVGIMAIGGAFFFSYRTITEQEQQLAQATTQMVERYLEEGDRILEAVGRVAEQVTPEKIDNVMQSSWEAYGYFETIYYLDADNKVQFMVPADPRYQGVDLSNLPYFQHVIKTERLMISRPFISFRTGEPTVYLVKPLPKGGRVVGALNLGAVQQELEKQRVHFGGQTLFILDQFGTLLAHPEVRLTKEQANFSHLEIFRRGLTGNATMFYQYGSELMVGSVVLMKNLEWLVVCQMPLTQALAPYAWTMGLVVFATVLIWLMLWWNLRQELEHRVIAPIVALSDNTDALAAGHFAVVQESREAVDSFTELDKLKTDFANMSMTLQLRQAALLASEARYRSLFDGVPIGLFRARVSGELVDVNQAFCQMFGKIDVREMIGGNLFCFFVSEQEREKWRYVAESHQDMRNYEARLKRPDGTLMWVRINSRTVYEHEGQDILYDGSIEDITERKEAEEALVAVNEQLESKVDERTQELTAANQELISMNEELAGTLEKLKQTQEYLVQSEKMAAIGSLVVGIAHEINTPVGIGITVASQMQKLIQDVMVLYETGGMKRSDLSDFLADCQEAAQMILSNLQRSAQLIQRFKQISADGAPEERRRFAVRQHIDASLLGLAAIIKQHKHEIVTRCEPDVLIEGYPGAFEQVLSQLLMNSLMHAYDEGECGTISIEVIQTAKAVVVIYADDGRGIPLDVQAKIFNPFFTTKRGAGGIGLGLYIVYNIVTQQFGGTIRSGTRGGKGASFTITFPAINS